MEMPVARLRGPLPFAAHYWDGLHFAIHTHAHFEIMIALGDGGHHQVNDRHFQMRRGDIFLLGPYHDHRCDYPDPSLPRHFNLAFLPEAVAGGDGRPLKLEEWAVLHPFLTGDAPMPVRVPDDEFPGILAFADILVRIARDAKPYRERLGVAALQGLFFSIARHHEKPGSPPDPVALSTLRRIAEHFRGAVTTEALAAAEGLSPARLAQRFKRATGSTPKDALTRRRLMESRRLLETSSRSITEVMAESGFNDLSYFNRAFKADTGYSPREWRRRLHTQTKIPPGPPSMSPP
ncbi:MAG: helix-turn-helix transcriptional regulator [Spirochaetes bacterium]|nr:helix-turn-helix transcriptional regulator [Spirochaetota bacterium]